MFERLYAPVAELENGVLSRRAGLLYRQKIRVADIDRIVAVNKDAITHEEITVGFFDSTGDRVWLSEFDKNFTEVMASLRAIFSGMDLPNDLVGQKPFEKIQKVLWSASESESAGN